jgi:hypothetical protein
MALKLSLLILLISNYSSAEVCKVNQLNLKNSDELNQKINSSLTNFAIKPFIRTESEKMLSLLIRAKSPMITDWVKKRKLDPLKEPEKIALEWDKYYAKSFIINRYPTKNPNIDLEIEKTFDQLISENFTYKLIKKVESIFIKEKENSIKVINKYPFDDKDKKLIQEKIEKIKIYWPKKFAESKYNKTPLELFDWALAYDPHQNEINFGFHALMYSEQSLKAALSHEIAHAFDSCRWSSSFKQAWPFQKIGECLRSIAAIRDDSKIEVLLKNNKISPEQFQFMKANPTCNNSLYPPIGIQSDQLPETFADWFSAEATIPNDINSEFRSEFCIESTLNPGSSYLSNHDRFFKIYLSHPEIAKKLNEKSLSNYCGF